jgi:hypothetical protein
MKHSVNLYSTQSIPKLRDKKTSVNLCVINQKKIGVNPFNLCHPCSKKYQSEIKEPDHNHFVPKDDS